MHWKMIYCTAMLPLLTFGCHSQDGNGSGSASEATFHAQRERMVQQQIAARGVRNPRVLDAMQHVPRHEFVPATERGQAYADRPLPIGHGQTISQPYIVAFMSEALDPQPTDRVLEIGTGSGYQAAVLAELAGEVFSIEIVEPLASEARRTLERTGYDNVHLKSGDGYQGWAEHAPFDAIIVTCAPDHVPTPLVQQLKEGGRMMIPVGESHNQQLVLLRKKADGLEQESILPVRFVPMTGEAQR